MGVFGVFGVVFDFWLILCSCKQNIFRQVVCTVSFGKKTKKQPHIQLELEARLQVLNYLRLNYFYFSGCVTYIKLIFTLAKTKLSTLGGVFALLLAFLFLKSAKEQPKISVIPCALNVEDLKNGRRRCLVYGENYTVLESHIHL